MITTVKANYIDINGIIEWVLFYRLTKKVSPVDFLNLTDSLIQLPNFLFAVSLLTNLFFDTNLWIKFAISSGFYFLGQMLVTFRFGIGVIKLFYYPLSYFNRWDLIIVPIAFIPCFFIIGWWTFLIIPVYIMTNIVSLLILTSKEKRYYKVQWSRTISNYEVFKNNAFLMCYKFYAYKHDLVKDFEITEQELLDQDWLNAYKVMREGWGELEQYFIGNAKQSWEEYLHIEKY